MGTFIKHGMYGTSEYGSYHKMKGRCYDKKNNRYKYYGGKGIKVCERWLGEDGFINFFADMGMKPSAKHSIDRIDINKDYEPLNCKWATVKEQNNNRTGTMYFEINGVKKSFLEWVAHFGLDGNEVTLRQRFRYGWTPERVFTQKIREFKNPI